MYTSAPAQVASHATLKASGKASRTYAFCGLSGTLTGEHVLGGWLSKIGLDMTPVPHRAGWLNRIGRDLGNRPPFRQEVRTVCGDCNHGWMSRLERVRR